MSSIVTDEVSVAINDALGAGGAPDWIMVIPADGFSGRDGRGPYTVDPQEVIEATKALDFSVGLPIDYDHASDFAAPNGGRAPAAGWMTALQVRDGAIWAHVEWTDKGREAVASKEYRYISPVFSHDEKTGEVLTLLRAGLTNSPNLYDTAIYSRPTANSLEKTMAIEIEKHNERKRKIEAIKIPPRRCLALMFGADPFASINASRGELFPSRPESEEESADADDDAETGSTSLGVAADLLNCRVAGHDGTAECNHGGGDHVDMARQVLDRYSREEDARKKRREDVGQPMAKLRFV